jgi:type IV pilus secretin PilQ/predicted competence protein
VLLGCAWTLVAVWATAPAAAGPASSDQPIPAIVVAQARVPIVAQAQPPRQQPRLISLDFKDADINNILRILAEFSGLNIVTSEDVKGKVTVRLQNVPWQQALDSVVRAAKLAYVQEGNIIRVDRLQNLTQEAEAQFRADQREVEIAQRRAEAKLRLEEQEASRKLAEEKAALELAEQKRRSELERQKAEFELAEAKRKAQAEAEAAKREAEFQALPLVEEVITLKYAHVGKKRATKIDFFTDSVITEERAGIEETIRGQALAPGQPARGMLSSRGELTVDPRTNSIIIRDVPPNLAKIKEFIAKVDRPTPAIQIEARVVEIRKDDARSLGVVWGGAFTPRTGQDGVVADVRGAAPSRGEGDTAPRSTVVNAPPLTPAVVGGATPFGLALGFLASNFALDIQLNALEKEGRARVVSSPSLMTMDNEPANIAAGTKFPIISVQVVGGAQQPQIQNVDVTTRLQVTPRIVPGENKISVGVAVKRDTLGGTVQAAGLTAPIVNTRNTVTQAEIPDGGTLVISGLRESAEENTEEGVPWLRKIPVLGWLFKNDLTEARRSELVIFLSAKVVQNPGQAAALPGEIPAAPGAPAPPGATGKAPTPRGPLPAVSSAKPAPEARPAPQPAVEMGGR